MVADPGSPHFKVWLEVMIVKSDRAKTNYNPNSIARIIEKIKLIKPHEVHLNTAVRPPAEEWVEPLTQAELRELELQMEQELPGQIIRVVPRQTTQRSGLLQEDETLEEIIKLLTIRPCTVMDIANTTGLNPSAVGKHLEYLLNEGRVLRKMQDSEAYYHVNKEG